MKYLILSLLLLLLIIVILICITKNKNKKIKELENNILDRLSRESKDKLEELKETTQRKETEYSEQKQNIESQLQAIEQKLKEEKNRADELNSQINQRVEAQFQIEAEKLKLKLFEEETNCRTQMAADLEKYRIDIERQIEQFNTWKEESANEWVELREQIDDFKKKRDVINQEISRQRAIEEQQDFYRVNLDNDSKEDIEVLEEARLKLHKREILNKLIYDGYISKPAAEMIKRVLHGAKPSGIYKITRIKTGEVYIGKSTNINDRWIQHLKTCMGCGNIAHSILHTTMEKDGCENFTFEVLEEVPKDKLTEREHYWIDFYGAKEYGLNEKA